MCDLVVRADFLQDAGHPCVAFVLLLAVGATGWAFCFCVFGQLEVPSAQHLHAADSRPGLAFLLKHAWCNRAASLVFGKVS